MARGLRIAGVALAAAGLLAGCERDHTLAADSKICLPFNAAANNGALGGEAAALDDCLHRSAYRLARADDEADPVARAVVASCSEPLSRWNQVGMGASQPEAAEAVDLVTGQSGSPIGNRYAFTQGRALYYVVQARAGHCAVPDVK